MKFFILCVLSHHLNDMIFKYRPKTEYNFAKRRYFFLLMRLNNHK